jgi:hypothetical protein
MYACLVGIVHVMGFKFVYMKRLRIIVKKCSHVIE